MIKADWILKLVESRQSSSCHFGSRIRFVRGALNRRTTHAPIVSPGTSNPKVPGSRPRPLRFNIHLEQFFERFPRRCPNLSGWQRRPNAATGPFSRPSIMLLREHPAASKRGAGQPRQRDHLHLRSRLMRQAGVGRLCGRVQQSVADGGACRPCSDPSDPHPDRRRPLVCTSSLSVCRPRGRPCARREPNI